MQVLIPSTLIAVGVVGITTQGPFQGGSRVLCWCLLTYPVPGLELVQNHLTHPLQPRPDVFEHQGCSV